MLYLGRRRNAYIEHFDLVESEALLDTLWSYVDRAEFGWHTVWQVGDLVLWDNRCVMHRRDPFDPAATADHASHPDQGTGAPLRHEPRAKAWPLARGRAAPDSVSACPSQVLIVLCLMYLVMYMERVNIATAAPCMTADLGLNNTQFGLAISAFSYPYALISIRSEDGSATAFGPRRVLMLSGPCGMRRDGVHGLGRWPRIAARGANRAGLRRGLRLSNRDPRNVGLDAARSLGLCARHHSLCFPARKCADTTAHCWD